MPPTVSSTTNSEERIPKFININASSQTGSKLLDTAWSLPMVREAVDTIYDVHEKQINGKGWIPKGVYQMGINAANTGLSSGLKLAESTIETTKSVSKSVPTVIQNGIGSAIEKAKNGVEAVDDLGASGLQKLKETLPIVGETSEAAKEKALINGQKLGETLQEMVSGSWIGQKTLGIIDTTLTMTEKPLAFVGKVDVVTVPKKSEAKNGSGEVENGGEKKVVQFKVEEQQNKYTLDVYTYGLHGKLVDTARYFLRKVRHTRRTLRNTRNKGRKVLASTQRRSERRRVTPKKRIASLAETGTIGYFASLLRLDKMLKYFGLQIIPADRLKARQLLYPHMKLVPKCAPNPQEDAANIVKERIRSKRNRQSDSDEDENQSYDEARWIQQIDELENDESDDPENKPSDTSLDSLESFEYASASEGTPQRSPDHNHKAGQEENASQENNQPYHGDSQN